MDLSADTEGFSSHIIMWCMEIFSTLHDDPSTLTKYSENPSYTRAEADQRRRYVMVGSVQKIEET